MPVRRVELKSHFPLNSNAAFAKPFAALLETLINLGNNDSKTITNFAGGMAAGSASAVGQSWTDKIAAVAKTGKGSGKAPGDELQGVADDEWDD